MVKDFLAGFLQNSARARVLRAFVQNEEALSPKMLAKRAFVSAHAAAKECRALAGLGILVAVKKGAPRSCKGIEQMWMFNADFKHKRALADFVRDTSAPENANVLNALKGTGRLSLVVVSGSFLGDSSRPADILVAGDALDLRRLERAVRALEPRIGRELRYAAFSTPEFRYRLTVQDRLIRDTLDFPHRVLLNKGLV